MMESDQHTMMPELKMLSKHHPLPLANPNNPLATIVKDDALEDFKSEINLGLVLPFDFSKGGKIKKKSTFKKTSKLSWYDNQGNLHLLGVTFKGFGSGAGKLDYDVLNVLMSMAAEQKSESPSFNYETIRRRLGLKKGSHTNIKESIQNMLNMTVEFKKNFFTPDGENSVNIERHLIMSRKSVEKVDYSDYENLESRHTVTFDPDIAKNLISGYYSILNRDIYLKISSGPVKRLYQLLTTNRMVSKSDDFVLQIEEIASVLGLTNKSRFTKLITGYFEALLKDYDNFKYSIITVDRKKHVRVIFLNPIQIEHDQKSDSFFLALIDVYGPRIDEEGITLEALNDLRKKYPTITSFGKNKEILEVELYLDMILHQKYHLRSHIKSVKGLLVSALEKKIDLMAPDKFKLTAKEIHQKKLKEIDKARALEEINKRDRLKEVEAQKQKELVDKVFINIQKEPEVYQTYRHLAIERNKDIDLSDMFAERIVNDTIKVLIGERMMAGEKVMFTSKGRHERKLQ